MININHVKERGKLLIKKYYNKPQKISDSIFYSSNDLSDRTIEKFLPAMYACIISGLKDDDEGCSRCYKMKKEYIKEIITKKVYSIINNNNRLNEVCLKQSVDNIVNYYYGKFHRSLSREISFLPLELRLFTYVNMANKETNKQIIWHIMDRIALTLAKIGLKEYAQLIRILCWIYDVETKNSVADIDFISSMNTIEVARDKREEFLINRELHQDKIFDEFKNSISAYINLKLIQDKRAAVLTLDLFCSYFKDMPHIDVYNSNIKNYILMEDYQYIKELSFIDNTFEPIYNIYKINVKGKLEKIQTSGIIDSNEQELINSGLGTFYPQKTIEKIDIDRLKEETYIFSNNIVLDNVESFKQLLDEVSNRNLSTIALISSLSSNNIKISQDFNHIFNWLLNLATNGDTDAQNELGVMYGKGIRVAKDYDIALSWFNKAARDNNGYAQCNLAFMYESGEGVKKDYNIAIKWYNKAAQNGIAEAQYNLGVIYHSGIGVKQDYNEAIKWYNKADQNGDTDAQFNLGFMYYNGEGVRQDYKKGLELYNKAAESGQVLAQYNLGVVYLNGEGVKQNYEESIKWFEKAAENGCSEAQFILTKLAKTIGEKGL